MAKLIRRGKVWYSDIRMGKRRIRRALSTSRVLAEEKLGELIKERGAQRHGEVVTDLSWQSFKEKYLEHSKATKDHVTYGHDLRALNNLETAFAPRSVRQVTPELIDELYAQWIREGRGLYARNREVRAIKTAMRKAESWRYVQPANWRSVKEGKEPRGRLHFHTKEQTRHLIEFCRRRPISSLWLTVCLLGCRAGLRREEMYWLEWSDVDFKNNRIHIASKPGWNPKDYERRYIPMFPDLYEHLRQTHKKAENSWVLSQGGPRPTTGGMTTYFARLTRLAGLQGSIHTLRHTFGSHLAQAGVALQKIQQWMGHSSIQTTEIYAHLLPTDASEKLPDIS